MASSNDRKAKTPEIFTDLKIKTPPVNSVGFEALKSSVSHVLKYTKPIDAIKASLKMNQKSGFDCPGCAWPDPDDERSSIGEYCENGIKAMTEEMQKKLINREFFASHSVDELAELSDFEIGKSGRLSEPMYLAEGATHYQPISWDDAFNKVQTKQCFTPLEEPRMKLLFYTNCL
jgi:anaerobic selenocysteine-containing dehydrogenase